MRYRITIIGNRSVPLRCDPRGDRRSRPRPLIADLMRDVRASAGAHRGSEPPVSNRTVVGPRYPFVGGFPYEPSGFCGINPPSICRLILSLGKLAIEPLHFPEIGAQSRE